MTTTLTYVVGAGPYPYRAEGLRMTASEASSYLVRVHDMRPLEAAGVIDRVTIEAVREAAPPTVVLGPHGTYRVQGAEPVKRDLAHMRLVREWRLTPAEATSALDQAIY